MMRLLEYQAKDFLRKNGLKIPEGVVVEDPHDIPSDMQFPLVLKVQIPTGRRGKAGGVRVVKNPGEIRDTIEDLLSQTFYGFRPRKILIERFIDHTSELYLGITYDPLKRKPLLIFSPEGGIEVEDRKRMILELSVLRKTFPFQIKKFFIEAGFHGKTAIELSGIAWKCLNLFMDNHLTLLEINPLFETSEGFIVGDVHIEVDDDAGNLDYENEYKTEFEREAEEIDKIDYRGTARLVEFDGDIGLIIGGGGASLTIFDAVMRYGGRPANYCEVGGNPTVKKVSGITELILSRGVKGLLVITNVLNNTRVDLMARGVIKGVIESGKRPDEVIGIFRVPGAWEEEGRKILARYNVPFAGREVSIDEAVKLGLERMKGG